MTLILEIHLALACFALVLMALEDWLSCEIAPQWIILAGVNIVAFNISIGLPLNEFAQGIFVWFTGTILLFFGLHSLRSRTLIRQASIFQLPMYGLVVTTDIFFGAVSLFMLINMSFAIVFSWQRGIRIAQIFVPATPFSAPFALSLISVLTYRFTQADYAPQIAFPVNWITWTAVTVFCISICLVLWRVYDLTKNIKPVGDFPNPWDEDRRR